MQKKVFGVKATKDCPGLLRSLKYLLCTCARAPMVRSYLNQAAQRFVLLLGHYGYLT